MPKLKPALSGEARIKARDEILYQLSSGQIHMGQAIRRMRLEFTGLSQSRFGKIAGFSANTISAIERDPESTEVRTLNKILRKFGMQLTLGTLVTSKPFSSS